MARRFDLTGSKDKIQRRNAQRNTYGNQTPLSSTAVERGETHWMDGSYVRIDGLLDVNGTATVGGTLSVTGTLNASGSINLSGSTGITGPLNITGTTTIGGNTNITGELNVTGPTTLDGITDIGGDTTITGLLDITGDTTVDGNFEILGNGLFKAGETQIEPTGKATFGDVIIDPLSLYLIKTPGGYISGTGSDDITLASSGTSSVTLNATNAILSYKTSNIKLTVQDTVISNRLTVNGSIETKQNLVVRGGTVILENLPTTGQPANLYVNSSGYLYRSTAA